jgi:hypothetical protein
MPQIAIRPDQAAWQDDQPEQIFSRNMSSKGSGNELEG